MFAVGQFVHCSPDTNTAVGGTHFFSAYYSVQQPAVQQVIAAGKKKGEYFFLQDVFK